MSDNEVIVGLSYQLIDSGELEKEFASIKEAYALHTGTVQTCLVISLLSGLIRTIKSGTTTTLQSSCWKRNSTMLGEVILAGVVFGVLWVIGGKR